MLGAFGSFETNSHFYFGDTILDLQISKRVSLAVKPDAVGLYLIRKGWKNTVVQVTKIRKTEKSIMFLGSGSKKDVTIYRISLEILLVILDVKIESGCLIAAKIKEVLRSENPNVLCFTVIIEGFKV